jgi:hypothetical protein
MQDAVQASRISAASISIGAASRPRTLAVFISCPGR